MSLAAMDLNRKLFGSQLILLRSGTAVVVVIAVPGLERVVRIDLIHGTWNLLVLHTRTIFSSSPRFIYLHIASFVLFLCFFSLPW